MHPFFIFAANDLNHSFRKARLFRIECIQWFSGALYDNRSEGKDAGKTSGRFDIPSTQCGAHVVKFVGVVKGEAWRPTCVRLNQINIHLCHVVSLMH
jgi:hypothetical protein